MVQPTPHLEILSEEPYNAETMPEQQTGVLTPIHSFYKRNHFSIPEIDVSGWELTIDGEVDRPRTFAYEAILGMPRRTLISTMECAGNGRCGFAPAANGEQWGYGAVSTAEWTGTPLAGVLDAVGIHQDVEEIVFEGADSGEPADLTRTISFDRSLPLSRALHPDTLLVYAMNGEPLPREHGAPLRLIVPGWYGMASVKWLTRISASIARYHGYFQWDRYVMVDPNDQRRREPLTAMKVRSIFTSPADGARLKPGRHHLRGLAWSGEAPLERVDVSMNGGKGWQSAWFTSVALPYTWRPWETTWDVHTPGGYAVQCRTTDVNGTEQPESAQWNQLGYCNNAIASMRITVEDD